VQLLDRTIDNVDEPVRAVLQCCCAHSNLCRSQRVELYLAELGMSLARNHDDDDDVGDRSDVLLEQKAMNLNKLRDSLATLRASLRANSAK
jgi:hypothetical protein